MIIDSVSTWVYDEESWVGTGSPTHTARLAGTGLACRCRQEKLTAGVPFITFSGRYATCGRLTVKRLPQLRRPQIDVRWRSSCVYSFRVLAQTQVGIPQEHPRKPTDTSSIAWAGVLERGTICYLRRDY
jgi:hypothetical protein